MDVRPTGEAGFIEEIQSRLIEAKEIGLSKRHLSSDHTALLVFVHGYNVQFDDAARRSAQLAYDLDFRGVPVFYSWPSKAGTLEYTHDETNVEWAVPHLAEFLRTLSEQCQSSSIYLVAHSMGTRCLVDALQQTATEPKGIPKNIKEVILAAPDIDADTFRTKIKKLLPTIRRTTLYASSNDRALALSKKVNGYSRAGDTGEKIVVVPPMDTIDATNVNTDFLGHSYYGDRDSIISDIFFLMREGKPPSERFGMRVMKLGMLNYWVFKPR